MAQLLRVVFFGSPRFAVPSLTALARDPRIDVRLVVTQPDRPAGRGRRLQAPAIKSRALQLGLAVAQPEGLKAPETASLLERQAAHLFVVVAYGEIFGRRLLALPPHGCLNVHPSLLPKYRGSTPIQAAILNGDHETGVSIIRLVRRLDAGPVVRQIATTLDGTETHGSLASRLASLAGDFLPGTLIEWAAGRLRPLTQDDTAASYTREITSQDAGIDWRRSAVEIERQVRALSPAPGAWTRLGGRRLRILDCDISFRDTSTVPGTIKPAASRPSNPLVATGSGTVRLLRVQPEGKPPMDAADWMRGARLSPGARFEVVK